MRYAFAGTPAFGAEVLADLLVLLPPPGLVVTQPPRPAGRGRRPTRSPVADTAAAAGLRVLETPDINDPTSLEALLEAGTETLVVAAFGQLLRPAVLHAFECVNVHASLLPSYRGAAPVARALMDGVAETGVCVMRMVEGLDEGPVALAVRVPVEPWDDAGTLGATLARRGAQATAQVLGDVERGSVRWVEQIGAGSYAAKLAAHERHIDLSLPASRVHDHIRALNPGLGSLVTLGGFEVKVEKARVGGEAEGASGCAYVANRPGAVTAEDGRLFVGCGSGCVELLRVQPPGKRSMGVAQFLRGYGRKVVSEPAVGRWLGGEREESDHGRS